jgi:hypothetical protein
MGPVSGTAVVARSAPGVVDAPGVVEPTPPGMERPTLGSAVAAVPPGPGGPTPTAGIPGPPAPIGMGVVAGAAPGVALGVAAAAPGAAGGAGAPGAPGGAGAADGAGPLATVAALSPPPHPANANIVATSAPTIVHRITSPPERPRTARPALWQVVATVSRNCPETEGNPAGQCRSGRNWVAADPWGAWPRPPNYAMRMAVERVAPRHSG